MSLDLTSFDAALKQHYQPERVENMVYKDNVFLAKLPKYEQFGGKNKPIPIIYGNPQGRSATFSTAVANKGNSSITDFVLTRAKDYSLASIDNETLEASKGNANAFMEAATTEIDGAIHSATRSLATALYRDGSGAIGRVSSPGASTTLTLVTPEDVTNFEVGMKVQFSSAATTASLRASGATLTVEGVNRSAGTLTMSANLTTIASIANNDYINVEGDLEAKIKGLEAWIPNSAPGATAFFGVDRSVDVTRLGGVRVTGTSMPIEEALITLASKIAREGGRPDCCFMNFENFINLEKALGAKVSYTEFSKGEVAFRGILIHGPRGPIEVYPDQNCPDAQAYMLQMDTWKLYSLGKAPKILETDGLKMLREASADAVEVRVGYYAQLGCVAPGWNGVVTL